MTRRYAMAGALAITTVVTFMLVVTGVNAGFFGGVHDDDAAVAEEIAPEDLKGALLYLAAQANPTAAAREIVAEPRIVTEYVYVYETVTPEKVQAAGVAPATAVPTVVVQAEPTPPAAQEPTVAPKPTEEPRGEEREDEEEHGEERDEHEEENDD